MLQCRKHVGLANFTRVIIHIPDGARRMTNQEIFKCVGQQFLTTGKGTLNAGNAESVHLVLVFVSEQLLQTSLVDSGVPPLMASSLSAATATRMGNDILEELQCKVRFVE